MATKKMNIFLINLNHRLTTTHIYFTKNCKNIIKVLIIQFACQPFSQPLLTLVFMFYFFHFINTIRLYYCVAVMGRVDIGDFASVAHYCVVEDLNMLSISLCMQYRASIFSRFPSNTEANTVNLLENLEEVFPRYCSQGVEQKTVSNLT